jgi:hypothetical protein
MVFRELREGSPHFKRSTYGIGGLARVKYALSYSQ